jgi:hypothetical protein
LTPFPSEPPRQTAGAGAGSPGGCLTHEAGKVVHVSDEVPRGSRRPPRSIQTLATILALLTAGSVFPTVAAAGRQRVLGPAYPRTPGTQIACFDRKHHRYYSRVEPWHCVLAGRVAAVGNVEIEPFPAPPGKGTFATFPIEGEWERIEWQQWGTDRAWGNSAVNARNGRSVDVYPSRRVRCADGSTWFSEAEIIVEDDVFVLPLPVCQGTRSREPE